MKILIRSALLLGLLGSTPGAATAQDDGRDCLERTVTCYRPEYRTRTVARTVCKVVPKEIEERYHYTELVRVETPQKRTETYCTVETRQVPYRYTESVPVCSRFSKWQTLTVTWRVCGTDSHTVRMTVRSSCR